MTYRGRLPAIAGIVFELQRVWEDTCVAGMWIRSLIYELDWKIDHNAPRSVSQQPAITTYLAPSWSWASANRSVETKHRAHIDAGKIDAELIYCPVTPVDPTATLGQLKGGVLGLRAAILAATEFLTPNGKGGYLPTVACHLDYDFDDGLKEELLSKSVFLRLRWGFSDSNKIYGLVLECINGFEFKRRGVFSHSDSAIWDKSKKTVITIL